MSRVVFCTGKAHQENAAIWARQRLADGAGRNFSGQNDQDGVLFADGVGLGKTWEALGAAALILYKGKPKAGRRHVMILCPPNLVSKWADELAAGSPFRARLAQWQSKLEATGNGTVARRVVETLSHVMPIRSSRHVRTKRRYGKFRPPGGTYIVSQSLITTGKRGLSALLRETWDVTIVDEAHNATARKALAALQGRGRAHTKLLLSATPFQLDPAQWNGLAKNLLKGNPNVLKQTDVARYIDLVADVFESPTRAGPTPKQVAEASRIFRYLAARTIPRVSRRAYRTLMLDGTVTDLAGRLDELDDVSVRALLERLKLANEANRDHAFEVSYVERRLDLATAPKSTFVATHLRRDTLAKGIGDHELASATCASTVGDSHAGNGYLRGYEDRAAAEDGCVHLMGGRGRHRRGGCTEAIARILLRDCHRSGTTPAPVASWKSMATEGRTTDCAGRAHVHQTSPR